VEIQVVRTRLLSRGCDIALPDSIQNNPVTVGKEDTRHGSSFFPRTHLPQPENPAPAIHLQKENRICIPTRTKNGNYYPYGSFIRSMRKRTISLSTNK
jgi:hypothetical protein